MSSSDGNEEKKAKLLIDLNEELQALIQPAVAVPLTTGNAKDVLQHKIKNVINEFKLHNCDVGSTAVQGKSMIS